MERQINCADILAFDDSARCMKMERVRGASFSDRDHDMIVVRQLLELCLDADSKMTSDGEMLCLQHGDAGRSNIIWIEPEKFVFIDLDNMRYYPLLLDVFHYLCAAGYDLKEIKHILDDHKELIEKICIRAGIDSKDNPLDVLFCNYAKPIKDGGFRQQIQGYIGFTLTYRV